MRHRLQLLAVLTATASFAMAPSADAVWRLYANNYSDRSISGFTLGGDGSMTEVPGSPLSTTPRFPQALAMTTDARFLFPEYQFGTDQMLQSFVIESNGALTPATGLVPSPDGPYGVVVSQSNKIAYVGYQSGVRTYDISDAGSITERPGSPLVTGSSNFEPSLSPNGQHLYILGTGPTRIHQYAIQPDGLPSFVSSIPFSHNFLEDIQLTPDGKFLYVLGYPGAGNFVIERFSVGAGGSLTSLGPVEIPSTGVETIAISPNGRFLFASALNSDAIVSYAIDASGSLILVGQFPADLPSGGGGVRGLAVSPDSRFVYAQRDSGPSTIKSFLIGAGGSLSPTNASAVAEESDGTTLAVTPDQPPRASFTVATGQGKQSFNGSASTDPDSAIAQYSWDFGDGTKRTTTTPTTDHTYKKAGKFQTTLTAIDDAGCSTGYITTGQIASCNGDAGAQTKREVVSPVPVIGSLTVSPRVFSAAKASAAMTAKKKRKKRTGTTFRYRVDRAAKVGFKIEQRTKGRKVGKKCKKKTRKNKRRKSCVLYVSKGTLTATAKIGSNSKKFNGKLRGRKLRRGNYRATAIATTSDKYSSAPRSVSFRVK